METEDKFFYKKASKLSRNFETNVSEDYDDV